MTKNEVTKRIVLATIIEIANDLSADTKYNIDGVVVTPADIVEYAEKTISQLDNKNAKAVERAAKKRAEGDALKAAIEAVLTDTPMVIKDIVEALDVEDITSAKVVARLTALVKEGKVTKTDVKDEASGRKLKAYTRVAE